MTDTYHTAAKKSQFKDTEVLKELTTVSESEVEGDTVYQLEVPMMSIKNVTDALAYGPWYLHLWAPNETMGFVIFGGDEKHKAMCFNIQHPDKASWELAIAEGTARGISQDQLDFSLV